MGTAGRAGRGGCIAVAVACALAVCACGRVGFGEQADAGSDGAVACAARELCDDFEAPTIDPVWTVDPGVTRDTTLAHRGAASIRTHSQTLAAGQAAEFKLAQSRTVILDDPTTYVRAWLRLGALPADGNTMVVIYVEQGGGNHFGDYVIVQSTDFAVYSQFIDRSDLATTTPPIDTWFCALWSITRDSGDAGSLTVGGDVPPLLLADVPTDGTPPLAVMTFGIAFAANNAVQQPALDMWIDDVIVDKLPITCAE